MTAEGAKVVLTHGGWERLSANAQNARDSYNRGWEPVFVTAYREYVQNPSQARRARERLG
jgi:hypothetical protein